MNTPKTLTPAETWDIAADGWQRLGVEIERTEAPVTDLIWAALPPLTGLDVIELGSGSGELAAALADRVGPDGHVSATDISPAMTRNQTARLAGLPSVSVIGDVEATDLPFGDDSADVVVFRMGLMMALDPDRALQHIRRVLRPGGRFVTTVWGPVAENPWLTTVGMAAVAQGLVSGGPPIGPGQPFSLTDLDDLHRRFDAAGFTDVETHVYRGTRHYPDHTTQVDMALTLAPPLAAAATTMSDEQRTSLLDAVAGLTGQFRNDDGSLDLPVCAHAATGIAP